MKKKLTIVIKLGTSSIVDEKTFEPLLPVISVIVQTAVKLQQDGHRVILVSSGAIGTALRMMDLKKRPLHLPRVQALAALGQCKLLSMWYQLFNYMRQPIAQILITRNDIADKTQYDNAKNTFSELMHMGIIPIVNENDTLAVTEIKFGDNDTLSAITAGMVHADYLFLMTDVDCLYDKNPRIFPDAKPIEVVEDISVLEANVSGAGSAVGTGGMYTKIVAARLATAAGVTTVITRSSMPGNISDILKYIEEQKATQNTSTSTSQTSDAMAGEGPAGLKKEVERLTLRASETVIAPLHTRFLPASRPIRDEHFWLLHGLAPRGTLYIDEGAYTALTEKHSLLPVGIVDVEGEFAQQEAVGIVVVRKLMEAAPFKYERIDTMPTEVGRMIVNYSASEIRRIKGLRSTQISSILGYADTEHVAHRPNIALFPSERSRPTTPGFRPKDS